MLNSKNELFQHALIYFTAIAEVASLCLWHLPTAVTLSTDSQSCCL